MAPCVHRHTRPAITPVKKPIPSNSANALASVTVSRLRDRGVRAVGRRRWRRRRKPLFELSLWPWWVSVAIAGAVYVGVAYIAPAVVRDVPVMGRYLEVGFHPYWHALGGIGGVIFLIPAAMSLWNRARKIRLLDRQSGIDSIRRLSWKEFEELVGEAFRREGYSVRENVVAGADGGVDVRLRRGDRDYLVQCKHWAANRVSVAVVREMFGVMTAEGAAGVFVVCTGGFTAEAREFASGKPIKLVDGAALVEMMERVRRGGDGQERLARVFAGGASRGLAAGQGEERVTVGTEDACPRCGARLVVRTARKGKKKGGRFLGCASFPRCRFTQDLAAD